MSRETNASVAPAQLPNHLTALERKLGPIEHWPIERLTPYERNPRKHPEKQIVKLMASVSEFGIALPILVDVNGVIIAGHAIFEAAQRLKMRELPVLVAEDWSSAQVKAYRLADNKLAMLGTWDENLLAIELAEIIEIDEVPIEALGWDTAEIDLILDGQDDSSDSADAPVEVPRIPSSRPDDIWQLGPHRLPCGSCLEGENWTRLIDGRTAAMVFSDFPYNVSVSGHVCGLGKIQHAEFAMASGEMSKPRFTDFLADGIGQMNAHLKEGGVLTLAMDWRHSQEMLSALERNGLNLLNMCVWNKTNGGMGSLYRSKHELFWIAKKGKARHTNNVELGKHGRYRTNVWDYPGINSFGRSRMADLADHPTVKPVALVADAIRDVTNPGEIVLDGFMGSGTTILAAERTKRVAYGIEIDPGYVDVAIERWSKMTSKEAVLTESGEAFSEVAERRARELALEAGD